MRKKIAGICLAAVLSLGICACGFQVVEQSAATLVSEETAESQMSVNKEIEGSREATETATPKPAMVSKPTEKPAATEASKPTEKPVTTEASKSTEKPVVTEAPKPTEKPVEAEAPKPTEKPVVTEAPKPTEKPVEAEAPKPTELPVATEKPTVTEAPTNTPEPVHTHSFADRVVSEATCTDAKVIESVCTVCGASNGSRSEGGALGHDQTEHWSFGVEPTCEHGANKTFTCGRCGVKLGGEYVDALPHDWEETATTGCDCVTSGVTRQYCKNCGAKGDSWENGQYGGHNIVSYEVEEIDEEAFANGDADYIIIRTVTTCTTCNQDF